MWPAPSVISGSGSLPISPPVQCKQTMHHQSFIAWSRFWSWTYCESFGVSVYARHKLIEVFEGAFVAGCVER